MNHRPSVLLGVLVLVSCGGRSTIDVAPPETTSTTPLGTSGGGSGGTSGSTMTGSGGTSGSTMTGSGGTMTGSGGTGFGGATTSTGGQGGCGGVGGCMPPLMCDAPLVPCNGVCIDGSADPKNCGACGHDCLGGACEVSACKPIVLSNAAPAFDVALDAANVYWVTPEGSVFTVPKSGGAAVELFHEPGAAWYGRESAIAVHGGKIHWLDSASAELLSMPTSGGAPVVLASQQWGHWSIASTDTGVYWARIFTNPQIAKIAAGAVKTSLVVKAPVSGKIAVDASHVYYGVAPMTQGQNRLVKVPIQGGQPIELAKDTAAGKVVVDSAFVYWTGTLDNGGVSGVWRVPLGGGTSTMLTSGPVFASGLAVDGTHVYVTDADPAAGRLLRLPIAGGETVVLAEGLERPWSVTLDDVAVYWTTLQGVMKLAK